MNRQDFRSFTRIEVRWAEVDAQKIVFNAHYLMYADVAITKTFRFDDYHETMAFVNAVAFIAHTQDHHPDLSVHYDRCEVRYSTHDVGGLSENDFICAAKAGALRYNSAIKNSDHATEERAPATEGAV
mgnify:CR=1 FL=1